MNDTPTDITPDETSGDRYDIVIVGGGPSGLSAGLFIARYGLRTLIFDRGKSSLRQCAYLENYLGFPGGIDIPNFLDLAHAHAKDVGCDIRKQRVSTVSRTCEDPRRFTIHTHTGQCYEADYLIAASPYDVQYLHALDEPALFNEAGQLNPPFDAYGRTAVAGLYLAGPVAGVESEAIISAGHAAQVALGLIRDMRRADGFWGGLAMYLDWQLWQGTCDGQAWAGQVHAYFEKTLPKDAQVDPASMREKIEQWIEVRRGQQLSKAEVMRRAARGRRLLNGCTQQPPHTTASNKRDPQTC